MAGRFAYMLIAGGAIVGGMVLQGDLKFSPDVGMIVGRLGSDGDDSMQPDRHEQRGDGTAAAQERRLARDEQAIQRDMADAVEEYARAEGSLIAVKLDGDTPADALAQAQARRDAARAAVDRLATEAKATRHPDRDALRNEIRRSVREAVGG